MIVYNYHMKNCNKESIINTIKELSFSEEIRVYKSKIMNEERIVSLEQAHAITEEYKNKPNEPTIIKRANAFAASLQKINIRIDAEERIVGNRTSGIRSGVVFPEAGLSWLEREFDSLDVREQDKFQKTSEDRKALFNVFLPFWKGKTLEDYINNKKGPEISELNKVVKINQKDHAQGHISPNVVTWLQEGPAGLRERAKKLMQSSSGKQKDFFKAIIIVLQAASEFMLRYAQLAEDLSKQKDNPSVTQKKYKEIALTCKKLSKDVAETFYESLQSTWFLFVLLQAESNASSFSPGRLDQYLLPYLERDLQTQKLSIKEAQILLEHLWLNFNKIVYMRNSDGARYFAGFPIGFNIAIGGQDEDSNDASNILSWMCLKAQEHIGLPQPNLSLRLHKNSPDNLIEYASRVIGLGSGMPQIFNDESVVPALERLGIEHKDALNYSIVGCVELSTSGNNLGWSDAAMFNMVKAFELVLSGGICLLSGKKIGPNFGSLTTYSSIQEIEVAFAKMLDYYIEKMITLCDFVDRAHAKILPSPLLSSVIDDCIKKGCDVTAGGANYNLSGIQLIQVANVADSMASIKQLVFDEKLITGPELLGALKTNWTNSEKLRQRILHHVPKYGNDVLWVDSIGNKWTEYFAKKLTEYANARGGCYHMGLYTVSAHVPMGKNVGASADGRKAKTPLADGGISAMYGRDVTGPTALLQSVSRINSIYASNGTLLNMKFLPDFFKSQDDIKKFAAMLKTLVLLKIHHVQFNVVKREDLIKAQENPEEYKNLTVRVAGYTAYFTELAKDLQNEIIARTDYGK